MSFCIECGARLGAEARFCAECGAAQAATAQPKVQGAALAPAKGTSSGAADGKITPAVSAAAGTPTWADAIPAIAPPPTGAQPPAPETPPGSRGARIPHAAIKLSQLPPAQTSAAAKDGLLALGVVSGVLLVTVAMAAGIFAPEGHHGSPADWLRTAVVILGLGVHAPAQLNVAVSAGEGVAADATFMVAATFTPLIVTALFGFVCFLLARRTERRNGSENLKAAATAAALTGAVFAGAAALLARLASGLPGFGISDALSLDSSTTASLGANPWYVLLAAFVLTAACTFLGRTTMLARSQGVTLSHLASAKVSPWLADLGMARNLFLGATLVAALGLACMFGWSGIHALFTSDPGSAVSPSAVDGSGHDAKAIIGVVLAGALLLPNLIVTAVGFALGGTLGFSGSGGARSSLLDSASWVGDLSNGVGLFTGGVPTTAYLIVIPMLLMALLLGIRATVQRPPGEAYAPHVWRTSALFAGAWVILAFLVRVSVTVGGNAAALSQSGEAQGSAAVGLGVPSILVAALLWGATATLGGALIARFVAAALPKPVSWLGGSDINPEWNLLIADAVLVRGGKIPRRLTAAVDDVRRGVRPQSPPLDVHPERDRLLAVSAASLMVVVVAGGIGYRVVQDNVFGPNVVVKQYFSAVAARNVPAALQLLDATTSKGLDKTLLTSAAMLKVPSNTSISTTTVTGDHATVTVDQTLDGAHTQTTFTLTRQGSAGVIFDAWRLDSPFTQLTIGSDNDAAAALLTVNGVAAPSGTYPVFPGAYTVAQPKTGLYQSADTQVTSDGQGEVAATLNSWLDPSVQVAADRAVHTMLDTCATSTEADPPGCGFSYDFTGYSATNRVWSITDYPIVSVEVDSSGTISVATTSEGSAHLKAKDTDWDGTVTAVNEDRTINVSGTLFWDGGDPSTATMSSN